MGKGIRDFKRSLNGLDETAIQAAQTPQVIQPAQPIVTQTVDAQAQKVDA